MDRKWTPGPWIMGGSHVYTRSDEPSVAVVVRHRKEWEANCDLIAAAPDLYDALQAMVDYCNAECGSKIYPGHQANQALAKARGETQ